MSRISSQQAARNALIARYKPRIQAEQANICQRFLEDRDPPGMLHARCQLVDDVLHEIWQELCPHPSLALVAVGGYGRGLLWPYSDIDLLFLLPKRPDPKLAETLEQFIGLLWDIGLEIGHSVRTPEECLAEAAGDLTIETALVEARLLAGSEALFAELSAAFRKQLDPQTFFHSKRTEQTERYLRYQESPYSLEPNCKESPGGLRDLQSILWIAQAAGFGNTWKDLQLHGFITQQEAHGLQRRELFLQRLRIQLHIHVRRREDRLLFDHQRAIAEKMGFADTTSLLASEQLMQEYYRTAKAITQLNTILLQNIGTAIFPMRPHPPVPINKRFQAVNQLLDVTNEDVFNQKPGAILEAFLIMQQHSELRGMTARTIRALWRARTLVDHAFRDSPENKACFISLFQQERGVLHELRRMNQFEILGRYLPNFGDIVGRMQHDLFHAYTVDQHTMQVLRNLRRFLETEFAHEYPFCSQLISNFDRPWVLYIAAIFHDIAKGRGGNHSELGAEDARVFCESHGLDPEDRELIVWLVRQHLEMSSVAQKKDLSDPDVIAAFAALVGDERHLIALYLLTVADIRGTSPKVWNTWKGQLLEDLFRQTQRVLNSDGATPPKQGLIQEKQHEAERLMRFLAMPDGAHEILWKQLDTVYFQRHSAEEIAWHARMLHYRVASEEPVVKARICRHGAGIEVLAYTRDIKDLFVRMVGFFSRAGFNIMDAKIHTTRHGYALDSFIVLDVSGRDDDRDLIQYIEHELRDRLNRETAPDTPANVRLSRQVKHFPIQPTVSIYPDDKGTNFVMSVSAADRPGLLFTVATTLTEHGANLQTAKIATLGERVEDTFLISGGDLTDSASRIRLEGKLLERLKS
ncbi:[protein-PII] uridylyltransferase [Propionivibrio dicarboxylicus]|uniref:Bifunctional uridylyltransferase/uridylyl-removing enzyme n=1 Tax=Propionivibrio dicarboxylicus TaxID=83767 RepID=A0A1G8DBB6_9RHOO|nr:[protein-PII] uridylyltransferase [Propionivibrio dicarboxylicus]SDH55098.1 UTP--GlnB (protein PII) uridylyltransferase, GlnD [Propionivibrio dicarboxylicus]